MRTLIGFAPPPLIRCTYDVKDYRMIPTQTNCEPIWNGYAYTNCNECKIKDTCECWHELIKNDVIYSEDNS